MAAKLRLQELGKSEGYSPFRCAPWCFRKSDPSARSGPVGEAAALADAAGPLLPLRAEHRLPHALRPAELLQAVRVGAVRDAALPLARGHSGLEKV